MEQTLVGVGVACILAAIIGGGFKGLGVEIPAIRTTRRQLILALAGVVLIGAVRIHAQQKRRDSVDPSELVASALESYDTGDYVSAIQGFREAAELGNVEAQYHYGEMLFHGEGVVPDKAGAAKWVLLSAESGFPPAQAAAAQLALERTPPDSAEARMWADRSANQDDPVGLHVAAALETSNRARRTELLLRSAERGHAPSQLALGVLKWAEGNTANRSIGALDGMDWIKRAAKQGDQTAQLLLARLGLAFFKESADTSALAASYIWWLQAQRPHRPPFAADAETVASFDRVGPSLEERLSLSTELEAQRQAKDEPVHQSQLERHYRHGH
jgi:TPR repeat protein